MKYSKIIKRIKPGNEIGILIDAVTIVGVTSTNITLSVTGIGLVVIPIATIFASWFMCLLEKYYTVISVVYKLKFKKKYSLASKTVADFSSLNTVIHLEDGVNDQNEYNNLTATCTKFKKRNQKLVHLLF